jgi:hypothetical protein
MQLYYRNHVEVKYCPRVFGMQNVKWNAQRDYTYRFVEINLYLYFRN